MNGLGELHDRILATEVKSARDLAMQVLVANYFAENVVPQPIFLRLAELTGVEVQASRSF